MAVSVMGMGWTLAYYEGRRDRIETELASLAGESERPYKQCYPCTTKASYYQKGWHSVTPAQVARAQLQVEKWRGRMACIIRNLIERKLV
ncbi:hypothetical protein Q4519_14850 [Motilimonas sp. 1_MG-2023]|uniref:hypothetical protein n=1 Tax=Motilimonas sp. 1_MG-2023 TaxID=3062672 RepID=UPI0026E2AC29|nr:hypothetical protein [Motilimonas sp. 1_MG-2023]MDO6526963.1 hypothetical protein [Motilimonas sp. 1_MG-2023]